MNVPSPIRIPLSRSPSSSCTPAPASTALKTRPASRHSPISTSSPRPRPRGRCRPQDRRRRPYQQDATRRHPRLDPARRQVDRSLRLGYSLTGITNHPASAEATGLEVDKLYRRVRSATTWTITSTCYKDAVGPDFMGKRACSYVITDSWEAGSQNWTDDMIAEFSKRRGYDPVPWLPVLTGRVVESCRSQRPLPLGLPQDHRRPHRR